MKVAYLFPGQGSQSIGMGADFAVHDPDALALFEEANIQLGYKLDSLCFYGPLEQLSQTLVTQPALFTVSAAALGALTSAGVKAEAAAGHSVGEYAALLAAGVFDFGTGLNLVNQRASAMSRAAAASPGAMAAVLGLDATIVAEICTEAAGFGDGVVVPANYNGGGQVVISGVSAAVARASELAKGRGAKRVIPLPVSGAFHSPLMQPAADEMAKYFESAGFEDGRLPVVANVTADYETSSEDIKANLTNQISGPVRWEESIQTLLDDNFDVFIEIGNGSVLTGLLKRISKDVQGFSVSTLADVDTVVAALRS